MRKGITVFSLALTLAILTLPSCGRRENRALSGTLNAISQTAELGTVEYTFSKLYAADGASWYKYGSRKALFEAEARVKAGIKMDGFGSENITFVRDSGTVKVVLPHAEVLSFNMPPESIHSVYDHVDGLRDRFSAEERKVFADKAEKAMRAFVDSTAILQDAERNAELYFKSLLSQFGYDSQSVEVIFE